MTKEIWLPNSKTHVIVEDGQVKVWDAMTMTKQKLEKKELGFNFEREEEVEDRTDV